MATRVQGQLERYRDAVDAIASAVFAEIDRPGAPEAALDDALALLRRLERSSDSAHLWIFRDPVVFDLSEHVFDALEVRPDGRREWFHADLVSAVAAVARFDVMAEVVLRMGLAVAEREESEPAPGEA